MQQEFNLTPLTPQKLSEIAHETQKLGMSYNAKFDFSPESIKEIENFFKQYHDVIYKDRSSSVIMFGSYVGEVLIRNLGGKYVIPAVLSLSGEDQRIEDPVQVLSLIINDIKIELPHITVFPFEKVFKRIADGEGDSLDVYYQALSQIETQNK